MWFDVLRVGISEIKELFERGEEKKEASYEAVETVYRAANQTSSFLAQCFRTQENPNIELSNIWIEAATKVRSLDSDLYNRLLAKSEYWSNPEAYTKNELDRLNISLEAIKKDCKKIINNRD